MRSPRHSTRVLSCAVQRNASIRLTCSMHVPRARATFACSVSPRITHLCTHPRPRVPGLDDGCRPDGAAVCYRTGMWCLRPCGGRRATSRSCARLCGMARSSRRTMTCGSRCVFCASPFWFKTDYFSSSICFSTYCCCCYRFSCPHLKSISTTLGSILPSPNSHVRMPFSSSTTTDKQSASPSSYLISPTFTDSRSHSRAASIGRTMVYLVVRPRSAPTMFRIS
jgi:hypothetical protein